MKPLKDIIDSDNTYSPLADTFESFDYYWDTIQWGISYPLTDRVLPVVSVISVMLRGAL